MINRGLAEIDRMLDEARLDRSDIELCIATGGMVNMPAIWNGLVERFGRRVPALPNRDRIIAEGAAWIAHDGRRLTLAKPIELLIADGSGRGIYLPVVDAGLALPIENQVVAADQRRFFCADPRDGIAVFQFAKPRKVGLLQPGDERSTLCSLTLPVDPGARPFLERLECRVEIDHDYVAHVSLSSKLRGSTVEAELHDLDFGLVMPADGANTEVLEGGGEAGQDDHVRHKQKDRDAGPATVSGVNIVLRSNISNAEKWSLVSGDIVEYWKPNFLVKHSKYASQFQHDEKMYYVKCSHCQRTIYEITQQGPVDACRQFRCGEEK